MNLSNIKGFCFAIELIGMGVGLWTHFSDETSWIAIVLVITVVIHGFSILASLDSNSKYL